MTQTSLNGDVMIYSNSPSTPTGYGRQVNQLVTQMKKVGLNVAVACNFGAETGIEKFPTKFGEVDLYPKSYTPYSLDMLGNNFRHFTENSKNPKMLMTIFDVWVMHGVPDLDNFEIHSWTPVDHLSLVPAVAQWLQKDNVHPIAMSLDGQEQMKQAEIEAPFIPHTVDRSIFKPGQKIDDDSGRKYLKAKDDEFVFGIVAANKANKYIHRKAFAELLLSFGMHVKKHPKSKLYIHSEYSAQLGGFDLVRLLKVCGVPDENVIFPNNLRLRYGFSDTEMAAIYEGIDCLLAPSYGEGFQVPLIESMSVGTRVIASDYTAPKDIVAEDCWKVKGQPIWDEISGSFFSIPNIGQILTAMSEAVETRKKSTTCIQRADEFETNKVFEEKWLPYLEENLK